MSDNNETPNFPKSFPICPACGCDKTLTGLVKADQVEKQLMNPEFKTGFQVAIPIVEPTRIMAQITAPVLMVLFDVCADCGTYYCREANVIKGMVGLNRDPDQNPGAFLLSSGGAR